MCLRKWLLSNKESQCWRTVNHEGKHCDVGSEDAQFTSIQTHLTFSLGFLQIKNEPHGDSTHKAWHFPVTHLITEPCDNFISYQLIKSPLLSIYWARSCAVGVRLFGGGTLLCQSRDWQLLWGKVLHPQKLGHTFRELVILQGSMTSAALVLPLTSGPILKFSKHSCRLTSEANGHGLGSGKASFRPTSLSLQNPRLFHPIQLFVYARKLYKAIMVKSQTLDSDAAGI